MPPRGFPPYPPPGFGSPMMPPPYWAPPPHRSFAKTIFITLAGFIFGLSLLANFYLLAISGIVSSQSSAFTEQTLVDGNARQKIAVIPIEGIIDEGTAAMVSRLLRMVERDDSIQALVLDVQTPGGAVTASDEIYSKLKATRNAKRERQSSFNIVVSMGGLATSGGYYVSAGADHIFAQPTTLTGNIGVLMPRFNLSGFIEKHGVTEKTLTAPPGGFKNAGSMFEPENPRDTKYLQGIIDQAFARFRSIVQDGRSGKLKAPINEIADGRVFTANDAKANGLIDDIGYMEDAWKWAAKQAGLSNPHVVRYQRRPTFLELMAAQSSVAAPKAVNVNVNLSASTIDELTTPRMLYLWRGE